MAAHLTVEERDRLVHLKYQGANQNEIAQALNRSPATISRELWRNATDGDYHAGQSEQLAARRRRERPLTRKMDKPQINEAVRSGLANYWSPEQIDGRMKLQEPEGQSHVSARTIYRWIKSDEERDYWESYLRRRGKRPFRRKTGHVGAPVADRPEVIEQRLRIGDFEGDTVLGPPGTGRLASLVDRRSRFTIVLKIRSKDAEHVYAKLKERLKQLDEERRRSLTLDNGKEFARCERLERYLAMELYYCDPGCPFQRGTNENTNGLIRQFFPKGTEFEQVTHYQVR